MERERLRYYDLISGLNLIRIIVMHIFQFSGNYYDTVFSFYMQVTFFFLPWFYFKAGYFYSNPKNGTKAYLIDKTKRLLLPFFIFTIIGFLIALPFELRDSTRPLWRIFLSPFYAMLRWGNGGNGNLPLWFLLSLFFTLTGFLFLNKFKLKWIIILFPVIGYVLYLYDVVLPLGLSNVFLAIFFLAAGNIYRHKIENKKFGPLLLGAAIGIYGFTQLFCFSSLDFRTNAVTSGNYFIYVISILAGLLLVYQIGKRINYIKPINYIGENSIVYFVAHWPIVLLVKNIMDSFSLKTSGYGYAAILSLVTFLLLPLCVKLLNGKLKFLLGR